MKPLIVLISSFLIGLILIKLLHKKFKWQLAGRIAMAIMLSFTAIGHFVFIEGMTAIIPDFIPLKKELVYATGILEVLLGIGLLIPKLKLKSGWILIMFFITILPANINASIKNINYQTGELDGNGLEYLWFRIPLQILFIVWVFYTAIKSNKPAPNNGS